MTLAVSLIALAVALISTLAVRSLRRTLHKSDTLLSMTTHSLEDATLKLHTVAIYAMSLQNTSTDEAVTIGGDLLKIIGFESHSDAHNGMDSAD